MRRLKSWAGKEKGSEATFLPICSEHRFEVLTVLAPEM